VLLHGDHVHFDDGSTACDFGFGTEPVIFER